MKSKRPLVPVDATHVRDGGRLLWYAAGCNYLGLSHHPRLREALVASLREAPIHPGASRATTGEHAAYLAAERSLARFLRTESAVLLPTGYMAALAAMHGLATLATDVVLHPAAHACLRDATRVSGLPVVGPWDGSAAGLRCLRTTAKPRSRWVVAMDGVAPAHGEVADLPGILAQVPRTGWLLVDDAHGVGVLGRCGRGICEHHGVDDDRVVVTGSLAKALGVSGGFVAGRRTPVDAARLSAVHVGTTSPPLAWVAGVRAALGLLGRERWRVHALQERAAWMHARLHDVPGVQVHPASPVVACVPRDARESARLQRGLTAAGIFPPFIRYPSAPKGGRHGFFRFAVSAVHEWEDLECLVQVLRSISPDTRPEVQDSYHRAVARGGVVGLNGTGRRL